MAYRIDLTEPAEVDMDAAYMWLSSRSPEFAGCWFRGLPDAIDSLEFMPRRFALSPNDGEGIRKMLYGTGGSQFHVLYRVIEPDIDESEGIVRILHVYYAGRGSETEAD